MKSCWEETPAKRPKFKKIVTTLEEIIISYHIGSINETASTASMESIEEPADANEIQRHIGRNGPDSYLELSRNVSVSIIKPTRDEGGSNVGQMQDNPGSYS